MDLSTIGVLLGMPKIFLGGEGDRKVPVRGPSRSFGGEAACRAGRCGGWGLGFGSALGCDDQHMSQGQ